MRKLFALMSALLLCAGVSAATPVVVDERLKLELIAQDPEIVTPTGIAVSETGAIYVLENNTHFRPANYKGAASDRILVFEDFGPDGKARKVSTFAEGFQDSMSLAFGPGGELFVATRASIFTLRQKDGKADAPRVLAKIETSCKYPHNGLSGFAFDPAGNVYFSLGENLGATYTLTGSDGVALSGGGEGGNIFRVRTDGSKLTRFATGFWNTFHLSFDAFGRLFAVDNDPDARPPCRLIHVVQNGDYGYRFRNARDGIHPFTSWNANLPGTLPMVAGTGEAPCAVLACESASFPEDYRGNLIGTSWGDHYIQRFVLKSVGASFTSEAVNIVKSGGDFRPVCMAPAPDGSFCFTDWVDGSYKIHGKGRVWRLSAKNAAPHDGVQIDNLPVDIGKLKALLPHPRLDVRIATARKLAASGADGIAALNSVLQESADERAQAAVLWGCAQLPPAECVKLASVGLQSKSAPVRAFAVQTLNQSGSDQTTLLLDLLAKDGSAEVRLQALNGLSGPRALEGALPFLKESDPFLFGAAMTIAAQSGADALIKLASVPDARTRLGVLLALRRRTEPNAKSLIPQFLKDSDAAVRRAAMQWVGEERLTDYSANLNAAARLPMTRELFMAFITSSQLLAGRGGKKSDDLIAAVAWDEAQPMSLRSMAMLMLRPVHPTLTVAKLHELLGGELAADAIHILALKNQEPAIAELRNAAANEKLDKNLRCEAIAALAGSAQTSKETQAVLLPLLDAPAYDVRREAIRALRSAAKEPDVLTKIAGLEKALPAITSEPERKELAEQLLFILKAGGKIAEELKALQQIAGARPQKDTEWVKALEGPSDAAAGKRIFFHARGAQCFACHQISGRGGAVGPELTGIGQTMTRERLIESIRDPSKEVAPQFVPWSIKTKKGEVFSGLLREEGKPGELTLTDNQGKLIRLRETDVDDRRSMKGSVMPDSLPELLTIQEFRDLLAYLSQLRQ